ncbi:alanyl-tRNA editing protein Aarsd1 isoform X2 [Acipenser ruthenus]|uniref:alanyl-tRNA editing protein Aarsd1 isoform X2 n=1 Tax=Acipenser ruthenus TaxID=7906 RepID=UPI002740782A|nr:alanyl-tRNA editing protein Aarsd1 isoform X2 [Acipenser ruthenus]
MAFQCQRDCYMREFTTSVVSCRPAELKIDNSGKKEKVKGFNIILKDTILFPEGGGQPDDQGVLNDIPVLRVTRQGADAVHFVTSPLEEGVEVQMKVDWERRFNHMQQHSGQHLITAIADSMFGFKTTSWELGRQRSVIELDTPSVEPGQVEALEKAVNKKIREQVPVSVKVLAVDDPTVEKVRSRGLPEDHTGPIRIIDIEGIDANMCCGTHVSNLSHLQAIKILGTEKGKKNKTNLIFVAGSRVLKYAERSYSVERALTSLLKKDGDNEFMNIIANEIGTEGTLIFLTVGDEKEAGLFLLAGPIEMVDTLGPRVAELLEGKGAGKRGRYQGKANKMGRRPEVEVLLQENIQHRSSEEE